MGGHRLPQQGPSLFSPPGPPKPYISNLCAHTCRPTTLQWRLTSRCRSSPPHPPPLLWCRPPRAWLFRGASQVPAVKMQRAMSALQTMLLRRSVPSWTLLGKSFLGLAKCVQAAAPLPPGGLREERVVLTAWRDQSRQLQWQLWCLAVLGEKEVAHGVSCVPCGARRTSAPSQLPEHRARLQHRQTPPTRPSCEDGATHWPSPSLRTGPRSPGPGRPLLDSGRKPELSVDSAAAQGALH